MLLSVALFTLSPTSCQVSANSSEKHCLHDFISFVLLLLMLFWGGRGYFLENVSKETVGVVCIILNQNF